MKRAFIPLSHRPYVRGSQLKETTKIDKLLTVKERADYLKKFVNLNDNNKEYVELKNQILHIFPNIINKA